MLAAVQLVVRSSYTVRTGSVIGVPPAPVTVRRMVPLAAGVKLYTVSGAASLPPAPQVAWVWSGLRPAVSPAETVRIVSSTVRAWLAVALSSPAAAVALWLWPWKLRFARSALRTSQLVVRSPRLLVVAAARSSFSSTLAAGRLAEGMPSNRATVCAFAVPLASTVTVAALASVKV